jgi:GNAT superfamily N-acetyltransferase
MIHTKECQDETIFMEYIVEEEIVSRLVLVRRTIMWLESVVKNHGYATELIQYCINLLKKRGEKWVLLDDMTTRYRKSHNVYIKLGFQYVDDGGPEMILYI